MHLAGTVAGAAPEERASPDAMLVGACGLLRESGRHGAVVAVILLVLSVAMASRLADGGPHGAVGLALLVAAGGLGLLSAGFVACSRRTLLGALARVRSRTGAPLDPGVPWTPSGAHTPLDVEIVVGELRRLLGAAHRCCALTSRAEKLAVAAGLLFVLWTLAGTG